MPENNSWCFWERISLGTKGSVNMPQRILVYTEKQRSQHHHDFRWTSTFCNSLQSSLHVSQPSSSAWTVLNVIQGMVYLWQTAFIVHHAGRQLWCCTARRVSYSNLRGIILFPLNLFLGLIPKLLIYLIYKNWLRSNFVHKEIIKPS